MWDRVGIKRGGIKWDIVWRTIVVAKSTSGLQAISRLVPREQNHDTVGVEEGRNGRRDGRIVEIAANPRADRQFRGGGARQVVKVADRQC